MIYKLQIKGQNHDLYANISVGFHS